ncbi:MAG: AAA family ATPase [Chlamydiota bacterium]
MFTRLPLAASSINLTSSLNPYLKKGTCSQHQVQKLFIHSTFSPQSFTSKSESRSKNNYDQSWKIGAVGGFAVGLLASQVFKTRDNEINVSEKPLDYCKIATEKRLIEIENNQSSPQGKFDKPSMISPELLFSENHQEWNGKVPDKDLFSLGGYSEVMEHLSDIVRYLQDPSASNSSGLKPPKGVVLSGEPGLGKSTIAEAIAGHAGVPLITVSGGELQGPLVGSAEAALRNIFERARELAPCVILIDEIDSIAPRRLSLPPNSPNAVHGKYINNTVNQLLTLLSQENPGVVVIGTTNNYQSLDTAVVRPGRFDKHIVITRPNYDDRIQIIKIYSKDKIFGEGISIEELASLTENYTGAGIASLINEAARCANRRKSKQIEWIDIDEARTLTTAGIKRKNSKSFKEKRITAIHEAGHALIAHLLGYDIFKVTVHNYGNASGYTEILPKKDITQQDFLNRICISLGGMAAEKSKGIESIGSQSDLTRAQMFADMLVDKGLGSTLTGLNKPLDIERILQEQLKRATKLLEDNEKQWNSLIEALIEHEELLKNDIIKTLNGQPLPQKPKESHDKSKSGSTFTLPPKISPKRTSVSPSEQPNEKEIESPSEQPSKKEIKDNFPFTDEEVAKVLEVPLDKIRTIKQRSHGGSVEITFKPSFKDQNWRWDIVDKLRDNDIECYIHDFSNGYQLEIYQRGLQDFYEFIKKQNGEDTGS